MRPWSGPTKRPWRIWSSSSSTKAPRPASSPLWLVVRLQPRRPAPYPHFSSCPKMDARKASLEALGADYERITKPCKEAAQSLQTLLAHKHATETTQAAKSKESSAQLQAVSARHKIVEKISTDLEAAIRGLESEIQDLTHCCTRADQWQQRLEAQLRTPLEFEPPCFPPVALDTATALLAQRVNTLIGNLHETHEQVEKTLDIL